MCAQCDPFHDSVSGSDAVGLVLLIHRAQAAITDSVLEQFDGALLSAAADLNGRRTFACTACMQLFILEYGSGHVLGDGWRPLHGN